MDEKEKTLDLKIRRKIYNFILKHPGLHEREIARQLGIPLSTLDYHLYYLKKRELISAKTDGHYTIFYVYGDVSLKDKEILAVLRQKVTRKIIIFLLEKKSAFHKDISEHIGLARSTTTFHLTKLVELEILERIAIGRDASFNVKEADYVSDLIITYRKSFVDDAIDRFADTWLELKPKNKEKQKNENKEED